MFAKKRPTHPRGYIGQISLRHGWLIFNLRGNIRPPNLTAKSAGKISSLSIAGFAEPRERIPNGPAGSGRSEFWSRAICAWIFLLSQRASQTHTHTYTKQITKEKPGKLRLALGLVSTRWWCSEESRHGTSHEFDDVERFVGRTISMKHFKFRNKVFFQTFILWDFTYPNLKEKLLDFFLFENA